MRPLKDTIKNIYEALKDPLVPEVEISNLEMLEVYLGQRVQVVDPHAGKSGRAWLGTVKSVENNIGIITIDSIGDKEFIDQDFKNGFRCFPLK